MHNVNVHIKFKTYAHVSVTDTVERSLQKPLHFQCYELN